MNAIMRIANIFDNMGNAVPMAQYHYTLPRTKDTW
jgi:hypothetical protein